jgi:hypothetical protein
MPMRISIRAAVIGAVAVTAAGIAAGATLGGSDDKQGVAAVARVPAREAFSGSVAGASGRYRGASGQVTLALTPAHSATSTRKLTVRLTGRNCATRNKCVDLDGRLHGTITAARDRIPDVGRPFGLALSGDVAPLGSVTVSGSVQGTGNIARGRERARITLKGAHGSITVSANSGTVPGFTSP